MKAAAFDYVAPRDAKDAVQALLASNGAGKLFAGGQSLGPMLNLRLVRPKLLIDVTRIDALNTIEDRGDSIRIGAGVTHAAIEDARNGLPREGMLQAVAASIAYRAIRNRGTIGGSLAHADPAADWPLALAALEAKAQLNGPHGMRSVRCDEFMLGAFTTVLAEDEIIEAIDVPKLSPAARWGYYKFCRKTGEFPEAAAAVVLDPERKVARVYVGALNGAPKSLDALAARLAKGEGVTSADFSAAVASVAPDLDASAQRMHAAALARTVMQVTQT